MPPGTKENRRWTIFPASCLKACALIPGGVNSPVRACHNVDSLPLFIAEAHGCRLTDVDGREYIDFVLSWGPMILGHDEPSVTAALREAVGRGTSYGAPCPDEVTRLPKWWPPCPAWKWCAWSIPHRSHHERFAPGAA